MHRLALCSLLIALMALVGSHAAGRERISLAGSWQFALDRQNEGIVHKWYRERLPGILRLPGSLQEQGFGDDVAVHTRWTGSILDSSWFTRPEYAPDRVPGNIRIPFWLQPEKHFVGIAWYQRDVDIPATWTSRRIVLVLERPHWETTVWLDSVLLGSQNSLSTPHRYVLPSIRTTGRHRLTVRVNNTMVIPVGVNAHSVSDQTQGNWNGIVGDLALVATEPVWIDDIQLWPGPDSGSARVTVSVGNVTGSPAEGSAVVTALQSDVIGRSSVQTIGPSGSKLECALSMGNAGTAWDEFRPALHPVRVTLAARSHGRTFRDTLDLSAGFRSVTRQGTQIAVNGRKVFLRGTLECCIFPRTGYPPTDTASWMGIMRIAAAHGLNHLRFHSWCPPRAAFEAADRTGLYLYVECPSWPNDGPSATVGDGLPVDRWLYEEADRILMEYGNHPSFILMSCGNEPGGQHQQKYLGDLVESWKQKDPRRLYTSAAGWPMIPQNDFHVTPDPRIQSWGGGLNSRINARPPETETDYREFIASAGAPVVSHEIGQWCAYPNFAEIPKYTGSLKPKNMEIFRDRLEARGMGDQARAFLIASGKLQTLCYKEEIESALRTPGMAGFELLDLHDFPGQGTALVGVLDAFWDQKGYVTPAEFSRFCASTVPLARMNKRVFTPGERFSAAIEIAHYGPEDLVGAVTRWRVRTAEGSTVATGTLPATDIPSGSLTTAGNVEWSGTGVARPAKLVLEVEITGTTWNNSWDFWVFPDPVEAPVPVGIHVASRLDHDALAVLQKGGSVLLLPSPSTIAGDEFGRVRIGFSSIFWNTAWTSRQAPHTLGILCEPTHPLFSSFPTDMHTNWQWWELVSRSHPFILNASPREYRPIVQVVDDWFTNRKLGLIFEARVAGGKLLACGIDITHDLGVRPVAAQLRRSLIDYMQGDRFQPRQSMDPAFVESLVGKPSRMEVHGAHVVRAAAAEPGAEASRILDGDPDTYWRTRSTGPGFPHELVIGLAQPAVVYGLNVTPRQDRRQGWINGFEVYVAENPDEWGLPVATGNFAQDARMKVITFSAPQRCRYLRFVATSSFSPAAPVATLGELELLFEDD